MDHRLSDAEGVQHLADDYEHAFFDASIAAGGYGGWQEIARVGSVKRSRSWRVTVHEPRPVANVSGQPWHPLWLPSAAAAAALPNRLVDIDAGLLLRAEWQRDRTDFAVVMDYTPGFSFNVQAGDLKVAARGRYAAAVGPGPTGGGVVIVGGTIEPSDGGATSSAWPPTRSKDTGDIAPIVAGVVDVVQIPIPPHARAFRWHQYKGAAAGGATAITFEQHDVGGGIARSVYRTATTAASWPTATGAIPVVGTAGRLHVQNNDAAATIAMWIEFLLDLGG